MNSFKDYPSRFYKKHKNVSAEHSAVDNVYVNVSNKYNVSTNDLFCSILCFYKLLGFFLFQWYVVFLNGVRGLNDCTILLLDSFIIFIIIIHYNLSYFLYNYFRCLLRTWSIVFTFYLKLIWLYHRFLFVHHLKKNMQLK